MRHRADGYAVPAALNGDRSHQAAFRDALRERAVLSHERLNAIDGVTSVMPDRRVLCDAQGESASRGDRCRLRAGALRETGVLCVYGSGFGTNPADGFFRVVFLASPQELSAIYDLIADFTKDFLARRDH